MSKVIVLAFAGEHVEVKEAQRLVGFGIRDRIELQVANPFVGRLDLLEFEAKDALVDAEHAVEDALIREIDAELLGVHVVFLLL